MMREEIPIAEYFAGKLEQFVEGTGRVLELGGKEIGIFRLRDKFFAYRNICPHQGGPACEGMVIGKVEAVLGTDRRVLSERFSDQEIHVVCPWHGWEFNVETGLCAADPRRGLQGIELVVKGDDLHVKF